jgi:3-oxoacyl-[acyl-carrier-protein] synthase-3/clorobiocin biosynthesis protein CloN2
MTEESAVRTPGIYLTATGTCVPSRTPIERALAQGYDLATGPEQLESVAVAGPVPAPEMALRAAQTAVKRAGQTPEELDLLLYASTWHQGPDGWLPHSYLQRHLVGGGVQAVEIRQGCNGVFMAFELAASYLAAVPEREAALIVAADNYGTPLLNRWNMGTGYVPGDAGSALVLSKRRGFAELVSVCSTTIAEGEELHRGGEPLFPPSITLGRSLDFTLRFQRYHAGPAKGASALARMPEEIVGIARRCLAEAGITADDVAKVAFINYSSHEVVEQRCMAPLGLEMSKSTWDFGRTVGHCGASDHVLSLDHLVTTGALAPGDHVLMLGVAPGVVLSAAVIKILEQPSWAG